MKAYYLILLNAVSLACFAQKSEEDAIKKVIQLETFSFFHKNYETWANMWAHDSAAFVTWSGTTEHTQLIGWNAIATRFKQEINNMAAPDEALIAPFLNKTDYRFFISGNTAIVTFKEGITDPTFQTRSLVKQNGSWKILSSTLVVNRSYRLMETVGLLRNVIGTWELDPGGPKIKTSDGVEVKNIRSEIAETANGFMMVSTGTLVSANGNVVNIPQETEFFIPDYNLMEVVCLDILKNEYGQTSTSPGKLKLNNDGSFTVRYMYAQKPTATKYEYTVKLEGGKWHQSTKWFAIDGRQTESFDNDMRKVTPNETAAAF